MKPTPTATPTPTPTPTRRPSKRLLFDGRYGWVLDEWKDPKEEALAGGRGMFCILPITKSLLKVATDSINAAADFAVRAIKNPEKFSPEALHANFSSKCQELIHFAEKPDEKLLTLRNGVSFVNVVTRKNET